MPIKLEQLHLNDASRSIEGLEETKAVPTDKQICDDVVLLWRQEPATEDLGLVELLEKVVHRNPSWDLSESKLKQTLIDHNLSFSDESKLFTYADQVVSAQCPFIDPKSLEKLELLETQPRGWSAFARKDLRRDEIIFYEHEALTPILPLDKTSLAEIGRSCSLCGTLLTQSSQFTMKNLLDCQFCSAVWCSKHCKRLEAATHSFLKHPTSKSKQVSATGWLDFEKMCKENAMHAAYSIGIIYARIILDKHDSDRIREQFESLAQVSQTLRTKSADSTNIGGTFDRAMGAVSSEDRSLWSNVFESFCSAFPNVEEEEGLNLETFLTYIGKFNINQLDGQIYTIYSHLNHKCEPNVRYEVDGKKGLKVFARKDIKKGEELFTTYVNPLHGVTLRRRELLVNWGFLCNCSRCHKELAARNKAGSTFGPKLDLPGIKVTRRKSSLKASKPDLSELLKNGQEFDLEVPDDLEFGRRRKSVRFDDRVMAAVEE
ncbi:LANO_0B00540g1_1 [Lachancea nothofagi CBS 11611]|uniref:Histone-lysine N-methyltransferase SET5 n=1 Tax=Lachancea nothofagi CBS 11611 TaxID=1266666 RepID=A0A1G4IUX3_9SACH|nr:LANO_0B00540g1_1 [Lachancea nothofagi CBS 11611]